MIKNFSYYEGLHAAKARQLSEERVQSLENNGPGKALEYTVKIIETFIINYCNNSNPYNRKYRVYWFRDHFDGIASIPWFKRGITKDVIKHFEEQGYKVSYNWFLNYLTFKW